VDSPFVWPTARRHPVNEGRALARLSYDDLARGAGGRIRTCSAPKRVTFWAWCVYLFRHAGKRSPGRIPTDGLLDEGQACW
jgi:hypothetical protein